MVFASPVIFLFVLALMATSVGLITRDAGAVSPLASARAVIQNDFADPAVLAADGLYYAYATNAHGQHVQVARSSDLHNWTPLADALPTLPAWAAAGGSWVWAPAVLQVGARFVLYYTARDAASGRQCVGVAESARPEGPFRDTRPRPLVCQVELGGTIDASPFRDGDGLYLYFKSDGNCCHLPTRLWGQRLSADGLSVVGQPAPLLRNDQPWEGAVVEAPDMVKHDDAYYLFYSGNDYAGARYAVGYARCQGPLGPCAKPAGNPTLSSGSRPAGFAGPGGADVFQAGDATDIAFHAWPVNASGALGGERFLLIGGLIWLDGRPVVTGI